MHIKDVLEIHNTGEVVKDSGHAHPESYDVSKYPALLRIIVGDTRANENTIGNPGRQTVLGGERQQRNRHTQTTTEPRGHEKYGGYSFYLFLSLSNTTSLSLSPHTHACV